jgi:hypothetical protein
MATHNLTAERAREVFSYDPETGLLCWRIALGRKIRAGARAGSLDKACGYLKVRVDGVTYRQHRVIWLMQTGAWPVGEIDHEDTVRSNNRWSNLRDVPNVVNQQNRRRAQRRNVTGFLGVSAQRRRFQAQISVSGVTKYLGKFDTPELAQAAYLDAKRRLHQGCTL